MINERYILILRDKHQRKKFTAQRGKTLMSIRLTGISTPIGGVEWEYTDNNEHISAFPITPDRKIRVLICSICGDNGKYDKAKKSLKKAIEDTGLAIAYIFEEKESPFMTVRENYTLTIENSDVCIFLINTSDGITADVQNEIDTIKRCNTNAFYYFCDEKDIDFDEICEKGAQAFVNDIVNIYICYCRGSLISKYKETDTNIPSEALSASAGDHVVAMPKTIIENTDKCKDYILRFTLGFSGGRFDGDEIKTCEIDEWAEQFLTIMFESNSIRSFNTSMFLDTIKEQQDEAYSRIVEFRWKAIQDYFLGDIGKCVHYLEEALALAKEMDQPTWVIQDILIDLRNQQLLLDTIKNRYKISAAQNELDESKDSVYYPVLDRINESLHEKYLAGLYKKKTGSPYTITLGSNFDQIGSLLASSFVIPFYNGSLTHLLIFYDKIKDFLFYLCSKYDDWKFRKDLLKIAVFGGRDNDVKGIINAYPEVLNEMNANYAAEIMAFCDNHPISFQRFRSQLLAFGAIGYYLNEEDFNNRESEIIAEIKKWLNNDNSVVETGQHIFKCLTDVAYRISQDELADICSLFLEKHYSRWYTDLFKFIADRININKMSEGSCEKLIQRIQGVLDNENERKCISYQPRFLYMLRKQNREATNELDKKVLEYFPDYYEGIYKLETTDNPKTDYLDYIHTCIEKIRERNETQGKNGTYFENGTRDIATIRSILLSDDSLCDDSTMDKIVSVVADTLIASKEGITIKLDAISLIICIAIRYPEVYSRNSDIIYAILQAKDSIEDINNTFMSSNVDKISIRIALALLNTAVGGDGNVDFLEGVSIIQSDKATILSVSRIIKEYLEVSEEILLPEVINVAVLQNALQWLQFDNLDIKYTATRILLMLSRNTENEAIVNQRIINMINYENVYLKNLILRAIYKEKGIYESTREYVVSKCQQDHCSVVRTVCKEVQDTKI